MEVYLVEDKNLQRVPESELETEANLERRLVRTEGAKIGDVEVMYTGRQGSPGDGGIFDLVGVDERGDAVIVELKRDRAPRDIVAQALEYAAEIRNVDYGYLDNDYQEFMREEQGYSNSDEIPELREAHAQYFALDEPLSEREFNDDQRLVVVGTDFRDSSLNMADFLREHGIDVVAVEYSTYRDDAGEVELLTTDGVRRPLREEPTTATTHSGSDYSRLLSTVRDRVYEEVADTMQFDSSDDMTCGKKMLQFTSQDPAFPEAVAIRFKPRIDREQSGSIDLLFWGGNEEEKEKTRPIINRYASELSGFEAGDGHILLKKNIDIDDEETEETVDEIVEGIVEVVEFFHPKLVEEIDTTE